MRYLLLSDVHANRVALDAVLEHAARTGWDEAVFLGDAVGYYADADATVRRLRDLAPAASVLGNHDALLLAILDGAAPPEEGGTGMVRDVLERHAEELSDDSVAFLRAMATHHLDAGWEAVHGALAKPWQYLDGVAQAEVNVPLLQRRLCFVGHTHVPRMVASVVGPGGKRMWRTVTFGEEGGRYRLPPRAEGFFNPGAVGQPRDGVPLASYAMFDTDGNTLDVHRVAFDVGEVQARLQARAYPDVLGARLAHGR